MIFSFPIYAAELIKDLPSNLNKDWLVCSHFKLQDPICNQMSLPLSNIKLEQQLEHQTFEKNIILSSSLKRQPIGIWLANVDEVDEVYLNDQLIAKTGNFLPHFVSGFRTQRYYLLPNESILFNQVNKLKIKTYSSQNLPGIKDQAPIICNYKNLLTQSKQQDYSVIISISILMLLSLFQLFYFTMLKANKETLYCALFFLSFILIALARSNIPIDFGLDINSAFKLESFMLNFAMISSVLFLYDFFQSKMGPVTIIGLALLGLTGIVIIIWPYPIYLRLLTEIAYWNLILLALFLNGNPLVVAIIKKKKYATIMLVTFLIAWFLLLYDAMMQTSGLFSIDISMNKELIPLSSALMGIILSLILTHKYWQHFKGSTYDHLTGALLRPAFFQRLSEEMLRCQRDNSHLLLAIIDIQQATKISAQFSHNSTNQLLMFVSNALKKTLRPFDLICRFGDEQFCIVASCQNTTDAEVCLKRLFEEIMKSQQSDNQDIALYLQTKIGGILYDKDLHLAISQLIKDANFALAKTKAKPNQNYLLLKNSLQVNQL